MPSEAPAMSNVSVIPLENLSMYLTLVGLISLKCKSVPQSESQMKEACTSLTNAVAKYRTILAPYNTILPSVDDIANLNTEDLSLPKYPIINPQKYRSMLKTLQRETAVYPNVLTGDTVHSAYFSKEKKDAREVMTGSGKGAADWSDFFEVAFASLGQIRLMRQEQSKGGQATRTMLVAALLPQLLVLTCVIVQFVMLKKRQLAAKKRNQQIARDRQLLDQLMERRQNQPIELV